MSMDRSSQMGTDVFIAIEVFSHKTSLYTASRSRGKMPGY